MMPRIAWRAQARGVASGGEILLDAAQGGIEGGTDRDIVGVGCVGGGEDLQQALFGNHLEVPFAAIRGELGRVNCLTIGESLVQASQSAAQVQLFATWTPDDRSPHAR